MKGISNVCYCTKNEVTPIAFVAARSGEVAAIAGEASDSLGRSKLLRWVVRRRYGAIGDAEDLLHEAFVRYEQYRRSMPVGNPAAFLFQVAANLAIDQRRARSHISSESFEEACMASVDPAPTAYDVLAGRERLERVRQGLETLNSRTREIFLMHRLDGRRHREIAASLGISCSAVEKHIAKAASFLTTWTEGW
jgi:RNA polymerase sigma factor (sigma-70 family)